MKVALPVWNDSISTVLDFAATLVVVDLNDGREMGRSTLALPEEPPVCRAARLRDLGIDVLICGALSQPMAESLRACGVEVIPFVGGRTNEVLNAYIEGRLKDTHFLLPGCGAGQRRRWRRRRRRGFRGGRGSNW